MDQEQEKFDKVIEALRRSRPSLGDPEQFSEKVIRQIQKERTSFSITELISELIFGWVYIGWIRRSMATAAICLMLFFGYQQTITLKRIEALSLRSLVDADLLNPSSSDPLPSRMKMFTVFGKKPGDRKSDISDKELDKFIESMNDLRLRYEDIFRKIETNPELKKYIDERLKKGESVKPNI
jgi:hypothetical protein